MFTIGITTFKRRLNMVEKLIKEIKEYLPNVEIILSVNADYQVAFDEEYRKSIMKICYENTNIFPIVFPTFTSLSKMWNSIILNSSNEFIFMLNDDIELANKVVFDKVEEYISEVIESGEISKEFFKVNDSFSHYVCSKRVIDDLGYFDERLLAFGEEDGDMVWRYIDKYKRDCESIEVEGIKNQAEGYMIAHNNMQIENVQGVRLVPKFNREFINKQKYKRSLLGIKGMFDYKMKKNMEDAIQYPYEHFKREHFEKL